jgi:small subunit ribosomal protein S17
MIGEGANMEDTRNERKERTGVVASDKMDKTRVVVIERTFSHPLYGKTVRRSSRIKVHDENNESHVGDKVTVMETRPISKEKRWRLVEIVERAK